MGSNADSSEDDLERDICEKIKRVMNDGDDTSEVPIIDIVDGSSTNDNAASSSLCPEFSDELDDFLEEQVLLKKIKKVRDYRRSFADYTDPELDKLDHRIEPKLKVNGETESGSEIPKCIASSDKNSSDDILIDNLLAADSGELYESYDVKETLRKVLKALFLNTLMQSELTNLDSFLINRLMENKKEQIDAKADVSKLKQVEGKKLKKKSKPVCWFNLFGRPYFKDKQKFACPKNVDFKKMQENNQIISSDLFPSRTWKVKERTYLEQGVRKILIEENIVQFCEKEKELQNVLKTDTSINAKKKTEIKCELKKIAKEIDQVKKKSLVVLFSNCNPDREFDWLRVSAQHVHLHSSEECQRMWHLFVKPTINKKKFTAEEDRNMIKLVEEYGEQNWDIIAKCLQTSRSEFLCFVNYQRRLSKGCRTMGKWTNEEDERLLSIIEEHKVGDYIPWPKVAYYFEERSLTQLYNRWNQSLNPNVRKGRFTKVEDKLIVSYVRKYGENFPKISKLLGHRTSTQIRERYCRKKSMVSQNVGRWSLEEDELLLSLVKKHGVKRWSLISKQFITRTRTQIRQRYSAIKNFIIKYPNLGIADIQRGPKARSQYLIPIKAEEIENASKEEENKMLSDLIKEGKIRNDLLKRQEKVVMTAMKRGRKQITKRSKVDLQLIDYFKEVFSNDKLKLRTDYVKPDVDSAANALKLFCHFFKTSLILSGDEFEKSLRKLPCTLKKVVLKMKETGSENVREILDETDRIDIINSQINSVISDTAAIDCLPVDPKETLVGENDYLLIGPSEGSELYESKSVQEKQKKLNFIPFFLPPCIISMIGCRSIMLIKQKIMNSLTQSYTESNYFYPNEVGLIKRNNLKVFNGYFSEEEFESDLSDKRDNSKHEIKEDKNKREISMLVAKTSKSSARSASYIDKDISESSGSNSKSNGTLSCLNNLNELKELPVSQNLEQISFASLPSTSTADTSLFISSENSREESSCEIYSDKPVETSLEEVSVIISKKLTKKEAIDLWKERLMALFGWPIVLANQPPNFPILKKEEEKENIVNEVELPFAPESTDMLAGKQNFPVQMEILTKIENPRRRYHHSKESKRHEDDEYDIKLKNYSSTVGKPSHSRDDGQNVVRKPAQSSGDGHIVVRTDDCLKMEAEIESLREKRKSKKYKKCYNLSKISPEDNSILQNSQNSEVGSSINESSESVNDNTKRLRRSSRLLEGFQTY